MGNALEVLRVATTFFVLLYHASLTYLATPMRLTLWSTYEGPGLVAFDYFVYWVNGFAMPVFFLSAGVSAPASCASRGPMVFVTSRVKRLLRPLLFGCLTILPFTYLVWGYGLMVTGGHRSREHPEVAVQPRGDPPPLRPGALLVPRIPLPGQPPLVWRLDDPRPTCSARRQRGRGRGLVAAAPRLAVAAALAGHPDRPDLPASIPTRCSAWTTRSSPTSSGCFTTRTSSPSGGWISKTRDPRRGSSPTARSTWSCRSCSSP